MRLMASFLPHFIYITRLSIGQGDQLYALPVGTIKLEYGNTIISEGNFRDETLLV